MTGPLDRFLRVAIIMIAVFCAGISSTASPQDCTSCAIIERVLQDKAQIKVGMSRADVEKNFMKDGGANFRSPTIYASRHCTYLKLKVEFEFDPGIDGRFSPKDSVSKISDLYADYPSRD